MNGNQATKKQLVGERAADFIKSGMVVGLGSGTTVYWMIKKLGKLVQAGMDIKGIPTSVRTEGWAKEFGIPLTTFSDINKINLAIDGANEIDDQWNLLKGGGGSLVREKIVNSLAEELIIIVDESKIVSQLGRLPLPVEILPFGMEVTKKHIEKLGCTAELRLEDDGKIFVSDNGNYILDCQFKTITDAKSLHEELKLMVGVVETGLFINLTNKVIVGSDLGVRVLDKERTNE